MHTLHSSVRQPLLVPVVLFSSPVSINYCVFVAADDRRLLWLTAQLPCRHPFPSVPPVFANSVPAPVNLSLRSLFTRFAVPPLHGSGRAWHWSLCFTNLLVSLIHGSFNSIFAETTGSPDQMPVRPQLAVPCCDRTISADVG